MIMQESRASRCCSKALPTGFGVAPIIEWYEVVHWIQLTNCQRIDLLCTASTRLCHGHEKPHSIFGVAPEYSSSRAYRESIS